ncbi:MAG: 30S ribosomal protein S16 [Candidatus Altimarinota bacterium]
MLRIRLTRTGKTAQKSFRIVVADHHKAVKRKNLEVLGHYLPTRAPKVLEFNIERIQYWISKGAQPSESVASLLKKNGVKDMEKYISFTPDKKSAKKKGGAEQPAAAAPAEQAAA